MRTSQQQASAGVARQSPTRMLSFARSSIVPERPRGATFSSDRDAGVFDAGGPAAGPAPGPAPAPAPAAPSPPISIPAPVVTVPTHIRGLASPAGMTDRIPPRVDTPVAVGITGLTRGITLSIEGSGGNNGSATIDGGATASLVTGATVQLRGVDQTVPGNAGNLRLAAHQGTTLMARSDPFSVSSIPQNWSVSFNRLRTGADRGIVVNDSWESDSGVVADLDETEISEEVQNDPGTGIFASITLSTSGFLPGHLFTTDQHGTTAAALTGPGTLSLRQTSQFNDRRSGSTNIPVRNSGYRINHSAFRLPIVGTLMFLTAKFGAAVTANGVTSAAGASTVTPRIQRV